MRTGGSSDISRAKCPPGVSRTLRSWRRIILLVGLIACGVGLMDAVALGVPPTSGSPPKPHFFGIQVFLNPDGSGEMFARSQAQSWSWKACPVSAPEDCQPFGTGRSVSTAGASAGVVFKVTDDQRNVGETPRWQGAVTSTSLPTVGGAVRANSLVTPVAGGWSGGWTGDFDLLQMSVCRNADGSDCTKLTDPPNLVGGCPSQAAVLDPAFAGWYLRLADYRYGVGTAFPAFAIVRYDGLIHVPPRGKGSGPLPPSPTVAVVILGPIGTATGPPSVRCGWPVAPSWTNGPAPSWANGPPAARISISGVSTVYCPPQTCVARVSARHGKRSVTTSKRMFRGGLFTLGLRGLTSRRLGRGHATITVTINGKIVRRRTLWLSSTKAGRY